MTAPGPTRTVAEAPQPVRAAALAHGLGDRYFEYGAAATKVLGTCLTALIGVAVAIFLWSGVASTKDPGFLVVLAVLFTIGGAMAVYSAGQALAKTGSTIHLFDGGLVHATGGGAVAYPWTDTEVRREITNHVRGKTVTSTDHVYRFTRPGTPELRLESTAFQLADLGPEIERRLTTARAPRDLEAVASGHTVRYGPLSVDIATLGTPKGLVKWTQVRAVDAHQGQVRIWLFEARRPQQVPVSEVPNVFVFLAMADALRIDAQRA
ncbi:DUF6585 family protein [Pseudonocardia sp. CA-107938]|uniref:DUF6585 family protein n=1 Tax=Pseudonocardia sp. CA-107938 TaxID=3240021 RepID=UPI003D89F209